MPSPLKDFGNRNGRKKLEAGQGSQIRTMSEYYHWQDYEASFNLCPISAGQGASTNEKSRHSWQIVGRRGFQYNEDG